MEGGEGLGQTQQSGEEYCRDFADVARNQEADERLFLVIPFRFSLFSFRRHNRAIGWGRGGKRVGGEEGRGSEEGGGGGRNGGKHGGAFVDNTD